MSPGSGVFKRPHQRPVLWLAAGLGTEPRQARAPGTVQPSVECWGGVPRAEVPPTSTLPLGPALPIPAQAAGEAGADQPARCPWAGRARSPAGQPEHCGDGGSGWREGQCWDWVSAGRGQASVWVSDTGNIIRRKGAKMALRHWSRPLRSPPRAGQGFKVYKYHRLALVTSCPMKLLEFINQQHLELSV